MIKKDFANYVGQLRIYSLIDLILLLIAVRANSYEFTGAILLHLGFLLYLEYVHKHPYRKSFHPSLWIIITILGIIFYAKLAVIGFLTFSFLYAEKQKKSLGPYSPLFRGLQIYFLVGGITGLTAPLSILSGSLIALRNFAGDLRDVTKDKKEGLRTLPILLGFKKDHKNLHLISLFITSIVWIYIAKISILWILPTYILQYITYNITPR